MFVRYHLATNRELPPITAPLYEYVFAGNGVFKRARRDVMSATIPISDCRIHGLATVEPGLVTSFDKVPAEIVEQILAAACDTARQDLEMLFHLSLQAGRWQLEIPRQIQTYDSVEPTEKGAGSSYERAIIEIHSHHRLPADFSTDDDKDETGFRIYGVIGRINPARDWWPEINLRIGVYGDWWSLPAERIIEMPPRLLDHNAIHE